MPKKYNLLIHPARMMFGLLSWFALLPSPGLGHYYLEKGNNDNEVGQLRENIGARELRNVGTQNLAERKGSKIHRDCSLEPIKFLFNESVPYTHEMQKAGEKIFDFIDGCPESQSCLWLDDAEVWNVRLSAVGTAFPIFENFNLPEASPKDGYDIISNAEVLFDESSVLNVHGVTRMVGPDAIGSYLGVPHSKVSGIGHSSDISRDFKITGANSVQVDIIRKEEWFHKNTSDTTLWRIGLAYYPCSTKIKSYILKFPDSTAANFVQSSQVPGMMEEVCNRIQMHCNGQHQQFNSFNDCMEYMRSLPVLDPLCKLNVGPLAVQGNCFMCKFLHQFMTPFEPEYHCYHSGKGLFDSKGARKCVPTDCLGSSTPSDIAPKLLFPPDAVTSETYFKHTGNGTFIETLVEPEIPRVVAEKSGTCKDKEANEIATATVLSLPMCMPSLSSGVVSAPCSQAVASLLGRFAENGSLCRCNGQILERSVMLKTLQIDAEVLFQLAAHTLSNTDVPSCISDFGFEVCQMETYRGKGVCMKWNFAKLENAIYEDWGEIAAIKGRVTKDDLIASAECQILSNWQRIVHSNNIYYTRTTASEPPLLNYPSDFMQVHPSLGPWERTHKGVLSAMQTDQIRTIDTNGVNNCWFGTNAKLLPFIKGSSDHNDRKFLLPVSYSTGSDMHRKSRSLFYELFPGMFATKTDISLSNMLDNVMALRRFTRKDLPILDSVDIRKVIREVIFRALMLDTIPYDSDKFGDDLEILAPESSGGVFITSQLSSLQGEFRPVVYKNALYQIQRYLQESSALTVDHMKTALEVSGLGDLLSPTGPGNAYMVASPLFDTGLFSSLVDRLRGDECESKNLIDEYGFHSFLLEHLRLTSFGSFKAQLGKNSFIGTYHHSSANIDPSVFADPLRFDPQRPNLNQVLYFNGLQKDFEDYSSEIGLFDTALNSSLKRGCPGRSLSMRVLKELAPLFFPQETSDYTCHAGMRARYGVKFKSSLVRVNDDVDLEVLKVDGNVKGKNLMILLHGFVDHPLGWSKFIEKMRRHRSRNSLDYWSAVMPGWGGKGTPLEQCDWPVIGSYIADLVTQARESYDRVFLFGRGDGGVVAQYAANEVGKDVLHGLITDALPPALYAATKMSKSLNRLDNMLLDPVFVDTVLTSDVFPLEALVENATWWDAAWEWEFRSFWKKTGGKQMACQMRSNWAVGEDKMPLLNNFNAAQMIDPNMSMLTISHGLDLHKPESLLKFGLKQITPRPGTVHRFEQVREKPDLMAHYYEDDPTDELAGLVSSFVDQSIAIRYSLWNILSKPPDFHESSYREYTTGYTVTFYCYILTAVIMLTGIIMEVSVGPFLAGKLGFGVYLFAQVMSATINFGCFFAADLITIPLYTMGIFKFGYPEVTSNLIAPLKHPEFFHNSKFLCCLSFISGIGYIIHHSGATLLYMVVSFHEMDPVSLGFMALAVGFQHLLVFIKYFAPNIHVFLLVGLEIWFQLEAYYCLTFATTTAKVGICMLLTSHYIWFIHGNVALIMDILSNRNREDETQLPAERNNDAKSTEAAIENERTNLRSQKKRSSLAMFQSVHSIGQTPRRNSFASNSHCRRRKRSGTLLDRSAIKHLLGFDFEFDEENEECHKSVKDTVGPANGDPEKGNSGLKAPNDSNIDMSDEGREPSKEFYENELGPSNRNPKGGYSNFLEYLETAMDAHTNTHTEKDSVAQVHKKQ